MGILSLLIGLLIGVGIWWLVSWPERARREALARLAQRTGLHFRPDRYRGMDKEFKAFPCLRRGKQRYGHNLLSGSYKGWRVDAFDYHYVTGSGNNRKHHRFSVVCVYSKIPLGPLLIRQETYLDSVADFFGFDDIDFESAEFSERFYVKAQDRRWAYDVIHPRTMEFLLDNPSFDIQMAGTTVMAWRDWRFDPEEFLRAFDLVIGILERLPTYVAEQGSQ